MKNPKKSARRRIRRGHAVVLWDPIVKSLYLADVPKRNSKDFLSRMKDRAAQALNFLKSGRPYQEGAPEYAK